MTLSITMFCHYAECHYARRRFLSIVIQHNSELHYAESCYAECRGAL
jgi:hypothetical protein